MRAWNGIAVGTVNQIEAGDLIAHEFLDGLVTGKVTAVVDYVYQLTDEQVAYLKEHNALPQGVEEDRKSFQMVSKSARLIFGHFVSDGPSYDHMYMSHDVAVAFFPVRAAGSTLYDSRYTFAGK